MKFNVEAVTDGAINWIREWFDKNGSNCNAVIGISGGKDSSVTAALCVRALGRDRVFGVLMPCGEQPDIDMAHLLVKHLNIRHAVIQLQAPVNAILQAVTEALGEASRQTWINLPPRVRMATLYAMSQTLNGRVANTSNLSEIWVGYSTRYGDNAGDFAPIGRLTATEVVNVGEYLGLPKELTAKPPADGLSGLTDEDNLGFTYMALDAYLRTGVCEDTIQRNMIDRMHARNAFKYNQLPAYEPGLKIKQYW